jgi:hypothetical protein
MGSGLPDLIPLGLAGACGLSAWVNEELSGRALRASSSNACLFQTKNGGVARINFPEAS